MTAPDPFRALLRDRIPSLEADLDAALTAQMVLGFQLGVRKDLHRAKRVILNLAIGDLGDLFRDSTVGSGRAAMRGTRSLIEAAINMHTVSTSDDDADRYLAHLDLGPVLMEQTAPGQDQLDARTRARYLHRLHVAGRSAAQRWSKSIARYGAKFKRSWDSRTLFERAQQAGRADLYEAYRIASLVAHGSSAGLAFGQGRISDKDRLGMMAGRVPYLVPSALLLGVEAYLEILKVLEQDTPPIDVALQWGAIDEAIVEAWPKLFALTDEFMEDTWRSMLEGPSSMACYLAFSRGGKRRWFVRIAMNRVHLLPAHPPQLTDAKKARLESLVDQYQADPTLPYSIGGFAAIAVEGVAAHIDWERQSIPLRALPLVVENKDEGGFTIFTDEAQLPWRPTAV